MRNSIRIPPEILSVMMLILLSGIVMSCASLGTGKEGKSSDIASAQKEGSGSYCEIIVCIGEIKDECEMRIGVMKNYEATIQTDNSKSYILEVEKAVSIKYLRDWMLKDALSLQRLGSGDELLYRKYKGENIEYYARYHSDLLLVTRKIRLDEQAPGYIFTYEQIFKAAEALVQKDRAQLGKETLLVKRRLFQKEPTDSFFISPIKQKDLY